MAADRRSHRTYLAGPAVAGDAGAPAHPGPVH